MPTDQSKTENNILERMLAPNPWPGTVKFVALLAFIYLMTALFVR